MQNDAPALNLRDLAPRLGLSYATLRGDWKERVKQGRIPAPFTTSGHPKWHACTISSWQQNPTQTLLAAQTANDHTLPKVKRHERAQESALDARLFGTALFG